MVQIQAEQILLFGGTSGIRDRGLLESAVAAPSMGIGGEFYHGDLFEMAGALLFSLAKNHPFIDGNKRAAAASALMFLLLNGIDIRVEEPAFSDMVIGVASGTFTREQAAGFLRARAGEPPVL